MAVLLLWWQAQLLVVKTRAADDVYDRITLAINETVVGARVVRLFDLGQSQTRYFQQTIAELNRLLRRVVFHTSYIVSSPVLIVGLAHAAIIVIGAGMLADGRLETGSYARPA